MYGVLELAKSAFTTKLFVENQRNIFFNAPCRLSTTFFSDVTDVYIYIYIYIYLIKVVLIGSLEADLKITFPMN